MGTGPDIGGAIERSRSARAALRSRRRRTAFLIGAIAAALAGGGVLSFDALSGGDAVHAAVAQAQSLADLLNGRSPGERTQAELTKTKRAAHAMPKVRMAPKQAPVPPKANMVEIAHLLQAPETPAVVNALPLTGIPFGPPTLGDIVIPPGGGGRPGGPGGSGGGGPGGGGGVIIPTTPTNPVTPPPAVPEPATWAMMLLGFGLVGWRVRGRKVTDALAA